MNTRIDLATTIHKCVRKILFEQAMLLARADYREESTCRDTCAALDRAFVMLREHADHEDRVIFPALAEIDGALGCEAARQHLGLEKHMRDIERTAAALRFATSSERLALGKELAQSFNQFVAAQLAHMAFEEVELQAALWRAKTDEELAAMRLAIRGLLTPDRGKVWQDLLQASADPVELSAFGPPPRDPEPLVA